MDAHKHNTETGRRVLKLASAGTCLAPHNALMMLSHRLFHNREDRDAQQNKCNFQKIVLRILELVMVDVV